MGAYVVENGSLTQIATNDSTKFATIESNYTASQAYAVGDYLILEETGNLYKVTTAISSGGTITVGTNVVAIKVCDELGNRYSTSDSANTTINDTDYIPISTSAGVKKKSLFSNLKNKLLGTTSISRIGDGTVKGAIVSLTSRAPRDITSDLTNLSTAISEQNLEKYGYKIGDYFTGTNYKYWLADLDTFYGGYNSYAVVGTHHIGIIVDTLTTSAYLASGTLSGYSTSTLHTFLTGTALPKIKADLKALFGGSTGAEHLIAHDKLYNTVSSWGWSSSNTKSEYISAPTEVQFVGCPIWSGNEYQQGEGDKQLELFRKYKYNAIFGNTSVWTRSIYSASIASILNSYGRANNCSLTDTLRAVGLILFK